ncbi:5795_t:CDS:2, partial [Acaulospora morrowiae]
IIHFFKAQYRKQLVKNHIEAYDLIQELETNTTPLNILDAILFTANA